MLIGYSIVRIVTSKMSCAQVRERERELWVALSETNAKEEAKELRSIGIKYMARQHML